MKNEVKHNPLKLGVIFLGRKRPGFDQEWGAAMEKRVREALEADPSLEILGGSLKVVDEASLRNAVAGYDQDGADALVVLQTTMGDGRLAPTLAQLWRDPIVLWSTPENPEGDMISSCSTVGTHCWASVFRQMGHAFELVGGDPELPEVQTKLRTAVRLVATVKRLRGLRMGLIGGQAPGYFAMNADPFVMHRGLGVQVQTFSLLEFERVLQSLDEKQVAEDVEQVQAMGLPLKDVTEEDLPMASRMYLTLRHFLESEGLDALTVRCWPEMANLLGQWPYFAIARLVEEGHAVACEGDADGALTAWIGERLGCGRCYLSDWLEHDEDTITTWHVGAAPMSLSPAPGKPGGPRLARHFNIKKPMVVEATLSADMPVTITRLWRCDGQYYLTAREGETVPPRRHLMATNGLVKLRDERPEGWFETLCHEGMPHHIALFRGHHQALLERFARLMKQRIL